MNTDVVKRELEIVRNAKNRKKTVLVAVRIDEDLAARLRAKIATTGVINDSMSEVLRAALREFTK